MTKWEYKIESFEKQIDRTLEDQLNDLGECCWELIKIQDELLYLKREKQEKA